MFELAHIVDMKESPRAGVSAGAITLGLYAYTSQMTGCPREASFPGEATLGFCVRSYYVNEGVSTRSGVRGYTESKDLPPFHDL